VNPRFTLVIVVVILLGLGGALYYFSSGTSAPAPSGRAPTPIAANAGASSSPETPVPAQPTPTAAPGGPPAHFILAISWEPAFCETAPSKPECRSMTAPRFDADHFALHGLWPDEEYCAVSEADESADRGGNWDELPAPKLSAATRSALGTAMPGTQSLLERHEWIKHGTCARAKADNYFARALALLAEINVSSVRELFAGNIGQSVTQGDIRAAFDAAFGNGAGQRVRIACERDGNRRIVTELTLGLYGDVMGTAPLASLIAAAHPTDGGCDAAIVDRAGQR
jgi:ribonuclease T2